MVKRFFGLISRLRFGNPIVIVSGLPRSGTSMVMQMLRAGGIEAATDNLRTEDEDNPRGYYELERVKQLDRGGETSWLKEHRGRAVKIVSPLLKHLPRRMNYRVVFIRRDLDEILLSQRKMLRRRGEDHDDADDGRLRENFTRHLRQVRFFFDRSPNFRTLFVDYRDIVDRPGEAAGRLNAFLGGKLDENAMAGAVDGSLYRNRRGNKAPKKAVSR